MSNKTKRPREQGSEEHEAPSDRQHGSQEPWDLILAHCRIATFTPGRPSSYGVVCEEGDGAIGILSGKIVYVGPYKDLSPQSLATAKARQDLQGKWVTPGFIDCHTHVVYGGDRSLEWELKLKGASYEEVAKAGGGIVNTVQNTRQNTVEELVRGADKRLRAMMSQGTTTVEVKSGYGLNAESERTMLLAGREIEKRYQLNVKTTFLGAHAVPQEFKEQPDKYIDQVVEMLPGLHQEGLVDAVDAFCETIGFSAVQTARVFDKASELKLPIRLHGDQLHDNGGGELAAKYHARSMDHCEYTSVEGVAAMKLAGTVAVLLPCANYFVKEVRKPPIAEFRKQEVPMALATNCNPGSSPCTSLLLCLNMACTLMGLSPEEALAGVTCHAARVLGMEATHGTIETGKVADLAVWDVTRLGELCYYLGMNPLVCVYHKGILRS